MLPTAVRDVAYRGFWFFPWLEAKTPKDRAAVVQKTLKLMGEGIMTPPVGAKDAAVPRGAFLLVAFLLACMCSVCCGDRLKIPLLVNILECCVSVLGMQGFSFC